ncbi:CLUMA_CG010781, isoform A [Clunio marinus]|uniref:CLUMA_CG010781, isoform A n=1 Tax=Clunio marinus TaxID=568069 RepID=A0A1J1IAS8_9DIPT|nr:CLUMA_CG010781, isoform A [Clunio marinus]
MHGELPTLMTSIVRAFVVSGYCCMTMRLALKRVTDVTTDDCHVWIAVRGKEKLEKLCRDPQMDRDMKKLRHVLKKFPLTLKEMSFLMLNNIFCFAKLLIIKSLPHTVRL